MTDLEMAAAAASKNADEMSALYGADSNEAAWAAYLERAAVEAARAEKSAQEKFNDAALAAAKAKVDGARCAVEFAHQLVREARCEADRERAARGIETARALFENAERELASVKEAAG